MVFLSYDFAAVNLVMTFQIVYSAPGYAGTYSNSEAAYGGNPCPDPYVMHQV